MNACSPGHLFSWMVMASLQSMAGVYLGGLTLGQAVVISTIINLSLFGPPGRVPASKPSRPYDIPFSIN